MQQASGSRSLLDHFSALKDPRQNWRVLYPLPEILLLVLCATLAGMEDFVEIRLWAEQRLDFLRRFLPYERGVPSHDTLNDVINALDPELFKACFLAWVEGLRDEAPEIIAIDGKTSRRSHDRGKGRKPLHMVSAWATSQRIVLGQQATEAKSNEITAIPLLLKNLDLKGALVTIDAMGTQTKIAQAIRDAGGTEPGDDPTVGKRGRTRSEVVGWPVPGLTKIPPTGRRKHSFLFYPQRPCEPTATLARMKSSIE